MENKKAVLVAMKEIISDKALSAAEAVNAVKAEFNKEENKGIEEDAEVAKVHSAAFNPAETAEDKLKALKALLS